MFFIGLLSCHQNKYTLNEDIVYAGGGNWDLSLDIAVPKTKGPYPLVAYYYGSGFYPLDRKENFAIIPEFMEHDYAVAFVSYRGIPDHTFPAQIHDAKAAIRWLRSHASGYDLDPDRFAAQGFSSGAYLALVVRNGNKHERYISEECWLFLESVF